MWTDDERPEFGEVQTIAKGLRSKAAVRKYFRDYRKKKKNGEVSAWCDQGALHWPVHTKLQRFRSHHSQRQLMKILPGRALYSCCCLAR